jgi:hypothetical protein
MAKLYGYVLAPKLTKGFHWIWEANNVLAFISNLDPNTKPKMLKVGPPAFLSLTPSVKGS